MALLFCIGVTCLLNGCGKKQDEEIITRYEWIELLTQRFGIKESINEEPYFEDVVFGNDYFDVIQAAVEWDILDEGQKFNGEDSATGEFMAITSMRAIGKHKIGIYKEKVDELSDKDYFKLAVKEKVIKKNQKKQAFSKEESIIILSKVMELYQNAMWKDDVSEVSYQKEVIHIQNDDILKITEDIMQVELKDNNSSLQVGSVIVIETSYTNEKISRKVKEISNGNCLILEEVELQEVINSVVISDISNISSDDIFSYYEELSKNGTVEKENVEIKNHAFVPVDYHNWESEGFTVQVESEGGEIVVALVDDGVSYKVPFANGSIKEGTVSATLNISNLCVGTQIVASAQNGVEYFNLQSQADIKMEGEISLEAEASKKIEIPLFKKPILLAGGIASVDVEFFFSIGIDGSVKLDARIVPRGALEYTKGQGLRSPQFNIEMEGPEIVADSNLSVYIRNEAIPRLLGMQLMDVELDVGIKGTGNSVSRSGSDIFLCADLSITAPILTVSVSNDDEKDTLIGDYISAEWEIFNEENAFHKSLLHYEFYLDGKIQKEDECTFKPKPIKIVSEFPHDYNAYFKEAVVDKGDYYEVKGRLVDTVSIILSQLLNMSTGDVYEYSGMKFFFEGVEKEETIVSVFPQEERMVFNNFYFTDENGERYYVWLSDEELLNAEMVAYPILCVEDRRYVSAIISEDFIFRISKNAGVSVDGQSINIVDVYENKIRDAEGICIVSDTNIPIYVHFDIDGNIIGMGAYTNKEESNIKYIQLGHEQAKEDAEYLGSVMGQ